MNILNTKLLCNYHSVLSTFFQNKSNETITTLQVKTVLVTMTKTLEPATKIEKND